MGQFVSDLVADLNFADFDISHSSRKELVSLAHSSVEHKRPEASKETQKNYQVS